MIKKIFIAIVLIAMLFTSASAVMAQTPQSITLKPGFTFVSFTNALSITPAQFKALNSAIEDVYLYSAVAGSFLSISEGTLTSLAAGKGYIVKSSASSNFAISVPGNVISSIGNITLKTGFNLVGFSKVPASMTFKQLMEAYSMIKGI
ncbi:MAG: hypothetical protein BWY32_03591 [bacterium ADurb.Bin243]|nr:MAG: hypothetical protein BWY32_03591 [bacterium ADurb.Bin243]